MMNFKRLTAVVMMLAVLLCFAACGQDPAASTPAATTTVAPSEPTNPTTQTPTSTGFQVPDNYTYRFKVVDQNGDIVVGATVQLCLESCLFKPTEVDGYAYFTNAVEDGYKVQVLMVPEGYTCNPDEVIYLEPGQTELTLTVTKNG